MTKSPTERDKEDTSWLAACCDRLNELVRENAGLFEECRDGKSAAALIQIIHGQFNGYRVRYQNQQSAIQVAREAMEASVDLIVALQNKPLVKCSKEWGDAIDKLRFALNNLPK